MSSILPEQPRAQLPFSLLSFLFLTYNMSLDYLLTMAGHEDASTPAPEGLAEDQPQRFTWETHPENPFNWSARQKWLQYSVGSLVTILVGLNSTVIATPGPTIVQEFNIGVENPDLDNAVWPITAWNTGAALGPMIIIPLLEALGMRYGCLVLTTF